MDRVTLRKYRWRYGESREDRAERMTAGLGPDTFVPGLPIPNGAPGAAIINNRLFDGYLEAETAANRNRAYRLVRSQRNASCETHAPWNTPAETVYLVLINPEMTRATACSCPDDEHCKHMMVVDNYLGSRTLDAGADGDSDGDVTADTEDAPAQPSGPRRSTRIRRQPNYYGRTQPPDSPVSETPATAASERGPRRSSRTSRRPVRYGYTPSAAGIGRGADRLRARQYLYRENTLRETRAKKDRDGRVQPATPEAKPKPTRTVPEKNKPKNQKIDQKAATGKEKTLLSDLF